MTAKKIAQDFPVVCVGGSAGGLDAYTRLHEILPSFTQMPVELITDRLDIKPNHVFIIPEQRDLHILDGEFRLKPISKPRGWPDVITVFLRSLTHRWGDGVSPAPLAVIASVMAIANSRSANDPQ
jgi:chemotaxis response regulator CheB